MDKESAWKILDDLVAAEGLCLFDVEVPSPRGGVLRVYITGIEGRGITHDQCAAVSHRILDHERVEELMPGSSTLEVSSPGVNRKLSRREHFASAVGERLKVTYVSGEAKQRLLSVGTLVRFDNDVLAIDDEEKKARVDIPMGDLREARVDFRF